MGRLPIPTGTHDNAASVCWVLTDRGRHDPKVIGKPDLDLDSNPLKPISIRIEWEQTFPSLDGRATVKFAANRARYPCTDE